jgi:hypothetical protein
MDARRSEGPTGLSVEGLGIELRSKFLTLGSIFYTLSVTALGGLLFNAAVNRVEPDREAMISVPARS